MKRGIELGPDLTIPELQLLYDLYLELKNNENVSGDLREKFEQFESQNMKAAILKFKEVEQNLNIERENRLDEFIDLINSKLIPAAKSTEIRVFL